MGGSFTTKLVIDSPGGSTYRKFLDCLWEIEIPFGGQIRLFFPQFQTEQYRDIVIVGNGTDTEDNESIFITHSGRKKPKEVLTYAHNLWVRFTTDSDYELSGWTMVVEAIPYTSRLPQIPHLHFVLLQSKSPNFLGVTAYINTNKEIKYRVAK